MHFKIVYSNSGLLGNEIRAFQEISIVSDKQDLKASNGCRRISSDKWPKLTLKNGRRWP